MSGKAKKPDILVETSVLGKENYENPFYKEQPSSILSSLGSVLVVIGTALVVFAAARNTITWYVQFCL